MPCTSIGITEGDIMNSKEQEQMQNEVSNAIWNIIKKEADNCETFHWEVTFKDKKGKTVTLEEGDCE